MPLRSNNCTFQAQIFLNHVYRRRRRGQRGTCPRNSEKIFSGNYRGKFCHFGQKLCKIRKCC